MHRPRHEQLVYRVNLTKNPITVIFFLSPLRRKKTALTLEELMHYQDDPWWKCVRRTLMISFWLALIAIFAASCIIVFLEDKQHCAIKINPTKSPADTISASDGVFSGNLSSVSTLLIDSTTKKLFNKSSIQY